jgi:hypothetical protein
MIKRKRFWGKAICIFVALAVAAVVTWHLTTHHYQSSSSNCRTVRAMIDYNKSQGRIIALAFNPERGSETSVSEYQDWANHLQNYAARISSSDLATHAHRLADDANKMVALVKEVRSDTSAPTDPSAPPPWMRPYVDLSKQFRSELVALNSACPG